MRFKRLLAQTLLFCSGALLFSVPAWAASTYAVDITTATVGTHSSIEIEYTVDTAQQTWADADTLTIAVPANYPNWASLTYTAEYDSDVTNNGTGETAITAGGGNGQYSVSTNTLTIKWNVTGWGAVSNGASTIRVLITAGAIPQYAGSTSTFTFAGTTANGGDTNPSGTDTVNVSASDAAASVSLSQPQVGSEANTTTLTLTTSIDMATSDTIVFTLPDNLNLANMSATATDTFSGAGSFTCTKSAQTVTCTASDTITAGTGTIVLSGVYPVAAASSQTVTSLAVNDVSASGADISSDSSGSVTDTTGGNQHHSTTTTTTQTTTEEDTTDDSSEDTTATEEDSTDDSVTEEDASEEESTSTEEDTTDDSATEEDTSEEEDVHHESPFDDLDTVSWAVDAIATMSDAEIIEGNPDGSFAPNNNLNRAETATLLERIRTKLGVELGSDRAIQFKDVKASEWYASAVLHLRQLGVAQGNPDGTYTPGNSINRAEFVTLALRLYALTADESELAALEDARDAAMGSFSDVDASDWFAEDVNAAQTLGFVEGVACGANRCFKPEQNITRAEAAVILNKIFGASL